MAHYRIEGTKQSTGRSNRLTVSALGAAHAKELAEAKGIDVEFCERQDEEPPTDRQISYALALGIDVRGISSIREMSSAISIKTREDKPAHWAHVALAEELGIDTWDGIGKLEVFNLIFQWFCRPGQEERLCAWFAFRVYRHLCGNQSEVGQHSFPSARFDRIGAELAAEPGIRASIERAGRDGDPFIWFGSWKAPDGSVHQGNSTKSKAFKRAAELVEDLPRSGAPVASRGSFRSMDQTASALARNPTAVRATPLPSPPQNRTPAPAGLKTSVSVPRPAYRASGPTSGGTGTGSFHRMEAAAAALAQAREPARSAERPPAATPTASKQPVPAAPPAPRPPTAVGAGSGSFQRMETAAAALAQPREFHPPIELPSPPNPVARSSTARTCKRCGYNADEVSHDPAAECRRCGANYARVDAAIVQEQAAIEAVKVRVAQARELKKQKPAPVSPGVSWWRRMLDRFRRS